ncbi:bile acid:sodium symporter [Marinobacterium arenosum]|uniref:bile acid:sodium symporter n=1 Tax=Marinobacterium arenosum TaxID=2862496 RepID=UPI001C956214|nr:bile acid:sodium symporter [Marinobacterium arenosum]MBY4679029.1 bile acid:sodium symporter [Marinobacterium arenosum]
MKSAFLPAGLVLAFIIAWLQPLPGAQLKEAGLIPWMVVSIFLINGYQTNLSELPRSRIFLLAVLVGGLINLVLSPFIGLAAASLAGLSVGASLGLIVKATVPSTLSTCIVLTQLSGGYALWALVMTIVLNIVGVFSIPFMLQLTLEQAGAISIDPLALLWKLMLMVLLPFLAGLLLRRLATVDPQHLLLQYLPSSCVILTVWMSLSSSSEVFAQLELKSLTLIALASVAVHLLLMLIAWLAGRLMRLEWQALVALVFTASQKTLPVAVSVLAALNQSLGEALLVCVTFHFLQLFIDSLLPGRIRRRMEGLSQQNRVNS